MFYARFFLAGDRTLWQSPATRLFRSNAVPEPPYKGPFCKPCVLFLGGIYRLIRHLTRTKSTFRPPRFIRLVHEPCCGRHWGYKHCWWPRCLQPFLLGLSRSRDGGRASTCCTFAGANFVSCSSFFLRRRPAGVLLPVATALDVFSSACGGSRPLACTQAALLPLLSCRG